jgi:glutamate-ammonia-ligase adenylyltransferase
LCAADSADPDAALSRFERFVRASGSALHVFSHLRADPRMVRVLLLTFGASPFLAEILVRHPGWLFWLSEPGVLVRPRGADDVWSEVRAALEPLRSDASRLDALRVAKRREILHVGIRDLLRLASVGETLLALSATAEALIEAALLVAETELRESLGLPPPPATPQRPGFVVLGMGKLGGRELNFSSDVDLIYVYDTDDGRMAPGLGTPSRSQYQQALARRLTVALGEVTGEGYVYRVDLRLRPEGRAGSVALPASAFASYYRTRGATWERLALLKASPVAGDRTLGARCLEETQGFVFGRPFGEPALEEVRRLKRQIDQKTTARSEQARHVKLGTGGIREVELLTQVLQARFGGERPRLRARGTLDALDALQEADLLAAADHRDLQRAYLFLRDVENKLQMVSDAQVHVLPEEPEELRRCALRLGYRDQHGVAAGEALADDYRRHTETVHRIYERVLVA